MSDAFSDCWGSDDDNYWKDRWDPPTEKSIPERAREILEELENNPKLFSEFNAILRSKKLDKIMKDDNK